MLNLITISNFDSKKFEILNACSNFGIIDSPETWADSLSVFKFDGEEVLDKVTSMLVGEYQKDLKKVMEDYKKPVSKRPSQDWLNEVAFFG